MIKSDNWKGSIILNAWAKKNAEVEAYATTGAKIRGFLKDVDTYTITILDKSQDKKYILFKSNLLYISKIKDFQNHIGGRKQ